MAHLGSRKLYWLNGRPRQSCIGAIWEAFTGMDISIEICPRNKCLQNIHGASINFVNLIWQLIWIEEGGGDHLKIFKILLNCQHCVLNWHKVGRHKREFHQNFSNLTCPLLYCVQSLNTISTQRLKKPQKNSGFPPSSTHISCKIKGEQDTAELGANTDANHTCNRFSCILFWQILLPWPQR